MNTHSKKQGLQHLATAVHEFSTQLMVLEKCTKVQKQQGKTLSA